MNCPLSVCLSPPTLPFTHCTLVVPQTCQAHTHLGAFALAVLCLDTLPPDSHAVHALPSHRPLLQCQLFRVLPSLFHIKGQLCHSPTSCPILLAFHHLTYPVCLSTRMSVPGGEELCSGHCPIPHAQHMAVIQTLAECEILTTEQKK